MEPGVHCDTARLDGRKLDEPPGSPPPLPPPQEAPGDVNAASSSTEPPSSGMEPSEAPPIVDPAPPLPSCVKEFKTQFLGGMAF